MVGGPETTNPNGGRAGNYLKTFLDHCSTGTNYVTGHTGSYLDFITFHAKGSPAVVDGHVRMNAGAQLRAIDAGCAIVASYPQYKDLPIVIGESDPEGCAACGMYTNPQNGYRNGTMYSSYTAATFARKYEIAARHGVHIAGAVTWAFEFEDQPWFHGFRDLATNGVDKPVLNTFRMFGKMSGTRVSVKGNSYSLDEFLEGSVRERDDVSALAALSDHSLAVMVWDYHDDNIADPGSEVEVRIFGIPVKRATLKHYRIDADHSNSYEAWLAMGSPQDPDSAQYKALEQAGKLAEFEAARDVRIRRGAYTASFNLPRQGISLLLFEW
jgi:xylan 1,4-beta-xylosidase